MIKLDFQAVIDKDNKNLQLANADFPEGTYKVHLELTPVEVDSNFQADDPSKILVGTEVAHQRFGNGKVIAIDGLGVNKMATIFFPGEGQKKLMLKFAKLKVLA